MFFSGSREGDPETVLYDDTEVVLYDNAESVLYKEITILALPLKLLRIDQFFLIINQLYGLDMPLEETRSTLVFKSCSRSIFI